MSPEEALQTLDQAASIAPLNRASHVQAQNAVKVLNLLIQEKRIAETTQKKQTQNKKT